MAERKYLISPVQIFCFVFLYLFSGMMMYAGGSASAALFAALFCACACVIACVLCENFSSARGFYASAFIILNIPYNLKIVNVICQFELLRICSKKCNT
jgi:FtsH-binding integral membrane protein